jgi:hypothetical protein
LLINQSIYRLITTFFTVLCDKNTLPAYITLLAIIPLLIKTFEGLLLRLYDLTIKLGFKMLLPLASAEEAL